MTIRKNPIPFIAVLAAALLLPAACKTTSTSTTTTPEGMSSSTSTTTTTPDMNAGTSSSTTSATSSSNMTAPQTTVVNNPNGTTTTTTHNLNGTTTTTTSSTTTDANGNVIATTPPVTTAVPTGVQQTSTSVQTAPTPAGGTKITTTTTTTFYGQPGVAVTSTPAPTPVTVITTNPNQPMASGGGGQEVDTNTNYFGFGPRHNRGRSFDLNLFADWANFSNTRGSGIPGTVATGPLGTSFKSANGYGVSLDAFVAPTLALELGASRINPDATFTATNAGFVPITGTRVRMTPITATLQWHFLANHSFDPYIGLGGAYVMFQNRTNVVGGTTGLQSVNFSDRGGLLADAGVGFGLSRGFGLIFDAKYLRLRGSGTTNFGNNTTVPASTFDLNPVILSAGIRFGF